MPSALGAILAVSLEVACIPGAQVAVLGASLSPRHRCVLFQTLWFDLQQRLSDEEGTNMVRPSPPLSSDLFLQPSEEGCSSMFLVTLLCPPLPKGHGEPWLQDSEREKKKHLARYRASLWPTLSSSCVCVFGRKGSLLATGCASRWGSLQLSD